MCTAPSLESAAKANSLPVEPKHQPGHAPTTDVNATSTDSSPIRLLPLQLQGTTGSNAAAAAAAAQLRQEPASRCACGWLCVGLLGVPKELYYYF